MNYQILSKVQRYILSIIEGKRKNFLIKTFLISLSILFRCVVCLRRILFDSKIFRRARVKPLVISVGNIVVGGVGKTPFIELLVRHLPFEKIGVLSRGYRSKIERQGKNVDLSTLDPKKLNPWLCGDETYMLLKKMCNVSFFVGKNRIFNARLAEKKGIEVILLDDGFQYLKLNKNKEIVVINADDPFGRGHFLPRGFLRDSPKQLRRADLIVLNGVESKEQFNLLQEKVRRFTPAPCLGTKVIVKNGLSVTGKKVGIFCGIGYPERFKKTVLDLDAEIVDERYTLDHLSFSLKEMIAFAKQCKNKGADFLLCTEKDYVKLPFPFTLPLPVHFLEISLFIIENGDKWQEFLMNLQKVNYE